MRKKWRCKEFLVLGEYIKGDLRCRGSEASAVEGGNKAEVVDLVYGMAYFVSGLCVGRVFGRALCGAGVQSGLSASIVFAE